MLQEMMGFFLGTGATPKKCDVVSYRAKIGEEAERRGAVDPERQEVLQMGMSRWLEGSTWQRQRQGAQERVDLALGEGTYSREDHIMTELNLVWISNLWLLRVERRFGLSGTENAKRSLKRQLKAALADCWHKTADPIINKNFRGGCQLVQMIDQTGANTDASGSANTDAATRQVPIMRANLGIFPSGGKDIIASNLRSDINAALVWL
ncbi:hypothetical protein EYF80_035401 [Liparis tanakae]|uniref:Uncharacterized protein n=1 Tax=Liparis tanakae TaxID=230148 RepID=A0A4Z2GNK5_9TELE|nr:hypothetical protein EYF80_035401 [Liparis tanakae]